MNLTSAGLGILGQRWPREKKGAKGQVGCSWEGWPSRESGQHEA